MIRILTDSASDILPAEAEQLGVTVIPLNVTLEDSTVLRDGVDMTPPNITASSPVVTSSPPPASPARSCSRTSSPKRPPPGTR